MLQQLAMIRNKAQKCVPVEICVKPAQNISVRVSIIPKPEPFSH